GQPVLRKSRLQPVGTRSYHSDLHVSPMLWVLRVAPPVIGYSRTPGERNSTVDDQRPAVRAVIESAKRPQSDGGIPGQFTVVFAKNPFDFLAERRRSDRVQQKFHDHSSTSALGQRVCKLEADSRVPVDVGFHCDGTLRAPNSLEHRREKGIAVVEDRDVVSLN